MASSSPGTDECRIDAALEAEARIGLDAQRAAGARRALRIEIGRLDEHVGGLVGAAGVLAAHDAAKAEHARIVGDDAHLLVDLVGLAVEREEVLARLAEPRADRARELVGVIDVQRPAAVVGDVVGDIDQRVDRAQADRLQPRAAASRGSGRS